jgi:hypothetical protein
MDGVVRFEVGTGLARECRWLLVERLKLAKAPEGRWISGA